MAKRSISSNGTSPCICATAEDTIAKKQTLAQVERLAHVPAGRARSNGRRESAAAWDACLFGMAAMTSDGSGGDDTARWRWRRHHLTRECFPPPSPHELLRYLAISERYSSRFRFLACSSVSGPVETAAGFACDYIA